MTEKIAVIGDTHINSFKLLPYEILRYIRGVEWVIHVGNYISLSVLRSFEKVKGKNFIGVYGNADPLNIREKLNSEEIVEIQGIRIGITNPIVGGHEQYVARRVLGKFAKNDLDCIVYGHTHHPKITTIKGILLINPGKGYIENNSFNKSAYIAIITIGKRINVEIKEISH